MHCPRPHRSAPGLKARPASLLVASLAATVLLLSAPSADAAQWKWRDAGGQIQYSDTPPPSSVKDQDILSRPRGRGTAPVSTPTAPPVPAAAPAINKGTSAGTEPELERKRLKAEAEKKAEDQAEEDRVQAETDKNCDRARAYLRTLEDGGRLARQNGKGEREVLDDKARAEEKARAREAITQFCR